MSTQESRADPKAPHCCKEGCEAAAEWSIHYGPRPDDYAHACTDCVGSLLSDSPVHTIYHL